MPLDRATVEKVSLLARLRLTAAELDTMTEQLGRIVEYVDQLAELDTAPVIPLAHAAELHNVFGEDEPRPGLTRDEALANAPRRDVECYCVPAVLGDSS